MPFNYNRLWKLLIDKDMNKTKLREMTGMGTATLAKLSANENVSMDIIDKICELLNCRIEDIVEHISDKKDGE